MFPSAMPFKNDSLMELLTAQYLAALTRATPTPAGMPPAPTTAPAGNNVSTNLQMLSHLQQQLALINYLPPLQMPAFPFFLDKDTPPKTSKTASPTPTRAPVTTQTPTAKDKFSISNLSMSFKAPEARTPAHSQTTSPATNQSSLSSTLSSTLSSPASLQDSNSSLSGGHLQRTVVNDETAGALQKWIKEHMDYPYPDKNELDQLVKDTGFSTKQVRGWFTNHRRRIAAEYEKEGKQLPWVKKQGPVRSTAKYTPY